MTITDDIRKFAAEQKISEEQALEVGLKEKAKEFVEKGAEVYAKAQFSPGELSDNAFAVHIVT